MTSYVALLRGINVAGQRKIKMDELRALFDRCGFENATTYIQSGNLVFTTSRTDNSGMETALEQAIQQDLTQTVIVLLRSRDEMAHVVQDNPFLREGVEDETKLHVTFLKSLPEYDRPEAVQVPMAEPARYRLAGREVFLHCPEGYGRTKLNNSFWERRLAVSATTRNWNSVKTLLGMASQTD